MPRAYKTAEARKDELLAIAGRLFAERGYANTSVQAIIDAADLSKGAFYHHFKSKSELLDALVTQVSEASMALVRPLLADPDLSAPEKLLQLYRRMNAWKLGQRELLLHMRRALNDDANLLLRVRQERTFRAAITPLLAELIAQGVREGHFTLRSPQGGGDVLWALIVSLGEGLTRALFGDAPAPEPYQAAINTVAAHTQAIERALGAAEGSLPLIQPAELRAWFEPLDSPQQQSPK